METVSSLTIKEIKNQISNISEVLAAGNVQDWSDYHYKVGCIRALEGMLAYVEELVERADNE